jgi:hypothetical protein
MNPSQTIELEFAPTGHPLTLAMSAVGRIERQLDDSTYRLEPLVRVNGRLISALDSDAEEATSYTWRIHLGPLERHAWNRLCHTVFAPLQEQGLTIRSRRIAA